MDKHFTVSVYIFKEEKVLLLKHPKFGKWMPPGGHVENHETFEEAARREVQEETGLSISFLSDDPLLVNNPNAITIPRPFMCLLENVPPWKGEKQHQHIDCIYCATVNEKSPHQPCPFHPQKWFALSEVLALKGEEEVFLETKEIIKTVLGKNLCLK